MTTVIWETENFKVVTSDRPFISREEGGHIVIVGNGDKYRYNSRLDFTNEEVLEEFALLKKICKAYKTAMKEQGVDIIRFNYWEAGNWAWKAKKPDGSAPTPYYHLHIFGRTLNAVHQKFPEAPYMPDRSTGFYDDFKPLTDEDIKKIIHEMEKLQPEN